MKKELKCAVIGLGQRGSMLLDSCLIPMARDEKETDLQVEQDERRRNARGLTRAKTILAGDLQVDNVAVTQKGNKTILGG